MTKKVKCPICKCEYSTDRVDFTETMNERGKWVNACPYCFDKSLNNKSLQRFMI